MILAYDTETTGFPLNGKPASHPDQPHIVQLGLLLMEDDGTERAHASVIVDPGAPIPDGAARIHGITDAVAMAAGISPVAAVALWSQFASRASVIIAHNAPFDWQVLGTAFARHASEAAWKRHAHRERVCTMRAAMPVLALPPTERQRVAGFTGSKQPSLTECMRHFFGEAHDKAHDAMADTRACARVFLHLRGLARAA